MLLNNNRRVFFLLFAVSGFTGLVYESVWSHYLKLFLGHAAYAQTLVLSIFMGGMAIGAWLASRYTARWQNLLLGYALVEAIIGAFALLFHNTFSVLSEVSFTFIIPSLGNPLWIDAYKWSVAVLLILPPSLLLGMTFPLMSGGLLRRYSDEQGASLAMLYFTNSIGAAVGALVTAFWLLARVGLPGTVRTAGIINLILAATMWYLARGPEQRPARKTPAADQNHLVPLFLVGAFITGTASFIYEISWIRMLSMVLGSTTHAFELMLSAFITGLAFGGLWIKKRIDSLANPVWFSGHVQLIMGLLALLTLVMYGTTFEWMGFIQAALSKSDQGYTLFNLASHLIAFAVMLPTTFLAGMTLPLFTHVLLKQGHGEKSLGRVYAANTLGAILGVMFAVHIGMPNLGLKMLLVVGVVLDIGLGLILLRHSTTSRRQSETLAAAVIGVGSVAIVLSGVHLDPYRMTSGVFRHGVASTPKDNEILFYQDGKTASISLHRAQDGITILSTNGKPDAAINMNPAHTAAPDEITMTMAAVLPLLFNPHAKTVANIGMGSGMTTHTLLAYPKLQKVDTIEIEKAVIKAAAGFLPRVAYAYSDPRSVFHIEDAKTYFSKHQTKYDIIVSEPSNPWVSGVANLFSEEFYQHIKQHLSEDGLLVQWLQLYEIDTDLVASVFKALVKHFKDYVIYNTDNANILILAKKVGDLPRPSPAPLHESELIDELAKIGILGLQDIEVRRLGDRRLFQPVFETFATPANSDYFPVLELNAPKTRFLGENAASLTRLSTAPLPVLEMLDQDRSTWPETRITWNPYFGRSQKTVHAFLIREYLLARIDSISTDLELNARRHLYHLTTVMNSGCGRIDQATWLDSVHWLAQATLPYLSSLELQPLWADDHKLLCAKVMTSASQQRFKLYQAIGARNAKAMATLGTRLLNAPGDHPDPSWRRYLLSAAMLGHLSAQEPEHALSLWKTFGPELYSDGGMPPYVVLLIRQSQTNHQLGTQIPQHADTGRLKYNSW